MKRSGYFFDTVSDYLVWAAKPWVCSPLYLSGGPAANPSAVLRINQVRYCQLYV